MPFSDIVSSFPKNYLKNHFSSVILQKILLFTYKGRGTKELEEYKMTAKCINVI
jgi:hypothetical protein